MYLCVTAGVVWRGVIGGGAGLHRACISLPEVRRQRHVQVLVKDSDGGKADRINSDAQLLHLILLCATSPPPALQGSANTACVNRRSTRLRDAWQAPTSQPSRVRPAGPVYLPCEDDVRSTHLEPSYGLADVILQLQLTYDTMRVVALLSSSCMNIRRLVLPGWLHSTLP